MTTGIYLIEFDGTNQVYVGQGYNVERRWKEHLLSFKHKTANYKLLDAYAKYGPPKFKIILECSIEELNNAEMEAFDIFDSINNGFNVAKFADIFQPGELNPASKYSNLQIRDCLTLLIEGSRTYKGIGELTGVSDSTVRHIVNGEAHTWLQEEMPLEYAKMVSMRSEFKGIGNSAIAKGIKYPRIVKDGVIKEVTNANAFAREHGLDSSYLIKLLNGKALSCKGWKIYKE